MTPLLTGVFASQISGHLTPPFVDNGAMEPIAMAIVGSGGTATVTFNSIPDTYKHLQVRMLVATDRPTYAIDNMFVTFNGDTANNYAWHSLECNVNGNSTATAAYTAPNDNARSGTLSSSAAPNVFTSTVLDILDYANTSKFKTTRSLSGYDVNGTVSGYYGTVQVYSSLWRSNNKITSITFNRQTGSNFIANSRFALYGIKG